MKKQILIIGVICLIFSSCKKDKESNNNIPNSVTDIDGNVYSTVKIGPQVWMKENLKVSRFNDGTPILEVEADSSWTNLAYAESETAAWCYLDKDVANNDTFGKLYNWYAVANSRELCPVGWHIPSDAEYTILTSYLGGEDVAGEKVKTIELWEQPNLASNSSGFSALPANIRTFDAAYSYGKYEAVFWTNSNDSETSGAWFRLLWNDQQNVIRGTENKYTGMSVRCLMD